MKERNSKLSKKMVLRSAALAVGYFVLMVIVDSLWRTGGSSLFYTDDPLGFIWFIPIALMLGAIVGMSSKCKSAKENS
jgi:hypothetical protein